MDDSELPLESDGTETPLILAIALKMAKLNFPELIYSGKIISETDSIDDCEFTLTARNSIGQSMPLQKISLEVLKIGQTRSLTAEYPAQETSPILWYGQHPLWMDCVSGKTVTRPETGIALERFARGILKKLEDFD